MEPTLEDYYKEAIRQIELEERERLTSKVESGFRRYLKKHVKREFIFDIVSSRVKQLPPPPKFKEPKDKKKLPPETLILLLGDMHLGSVACKRYLNGLGEFNSKIFVESLEFLYKELVSHIKDRAKIRRIERLHVFLLGDLIDGEGIFQGHPHEVDITVVDQVLKCSQYISKFLSDVSKFVKSMQVDCVAGNHGRISHDAPVTDNWEHFLYEFIAQQLSSHKNITVNPGREFFRIIDIYDYKFMMIHGHEIRTLTSAGLERLVGRYTQITRAGFDYLCMGHHHRHVQFEFNGVEVIVNPPFTYTSHYGLAKLALQSKPGQLLLGVDKDHGLSWRTKLPVCHSKESE